jgi:hypothetical protein
MQCREQLINGGAQGSELVVDIGEIFMPAHGFQFECQCGRGSGAEIG